MGLHQKACLSGQFPIHELVYKPYNYSCKYHKPNFIGVINQISNLVAPFCRYAIWLFNIAMERSTIFKFGKPSISMDHLYHGELVNPKYPLTLDERYPAFITGEPRYGLCWYSFIG